jgi:hypothetical protein
VTSPRTTSTIESRSRPVEIFLGVVVAVAALVPLTFIVGGLLSSAGRQDLRLTVFIGVPVATVVVIWCARTSWRLIAGQPRRDGWLISPWFIASGWHRLHRGVYVLPRATR